MVRVQKIGTLMGQHYLPISGTEVLLNWTRSHQDLFREGLSITYSTLLQCRCVQVAGPKRCLRREAAAGLAETRSFALVAAGGVESLATRIQVFFLTTARSLLQRTSLVCQRAYGM